MVQSFLVRTEIQKDGSQSLSKWKIYLNNELENDIQGQFPFENIKWLVDEGYTKLTLPKSTVEKVQQ